MKRQTYRFNINNRTIKITKNYTSVDPQIVRRAVFRKGEIFEAELPDGRVERLHVLPEIIDYKRVQKRTPKIHTRLSARELAERKAKFMDEWWGPRRLRGSDGRPIEPQPKRNPAGSKAARRAKRDTAKNKNGRERQLRLPHRPGRRKKNKQEMRARRFR